MHAAKMDKKRTASQRTTVETSTEGGSKPPKYSKLVLKPPKFITAPHHRAREQLHTVKTLASQLESVLELETHEEVLEQLLKICNLFLPTLEQLAKEDGIKSLVVLERLWNTHSESEDNIAVCSVLIRLVGLLAMKVVDSSKDEALWVKRMQKFTVKMTEHKNTDIKIVMLRCLQTLVTQFPHEVGFSQQVLADAQKMIHNIHHGVRVECLNLIGQLYHMTGDSEISLAILEDSCSDCDPRVRTAAFQALFKISQDKLTLPLSIYSKASDALVDDNEDVRMWAVRLVWALGLSFADRPIPLKPNSSVDIRILDDAFIKICDLVNDSSVHVRALAASLLGDFTSVSHKFLAQTLDKKLMSHLRVVKSDHERQRELHQGKGGGASMDWDSGRKWGNSSKAANKIALDPGEISLMSAGACGAFVHGLEDEFMEVRSAAVESICRLSIASLSFAVQSLDYLVDMFNDEIEGVRLKAINSLRQISATMELREDQLETVLAILEESSSEIREALRGLLSSCRITTRGGLNTAVHALLDNLKKYPMDRGSIWRCLKQLGCSHGYLTSALVPELLSTHPFFMGKEPDVDDPAYICILILVFNAASHCPTIPPLFPSHVFRHYTYLRDTLPELIPSIKAGMPTVLRVSQATRQRGQAGSKSFLSQVLSRAQLASKLHSGTESRRAWHTCITDLQKVAQLNKDFQSFANSTATFIQCQVLLNKVTEVLSQDVLLTSESSSQSSIPHITSSIRELLLLSYRLEHGYTNQSPRLLLKTRLIRLASHALSLLLAVHMDMDTEQSGQFLKVKQFFVERLNSLKRFCDGNSLDLPAAVVPLIDLDVHTISTESLIQSLQPLVTSHFCIQLPSNDLHLVKQCSAEVTDPQNFSREDFTKFVSTLALPVHVAASLTNIDNWKQMAIQARFPDGRCLLFPIKSSHVREVGVADAKLDMSVILSHGIWTEPCQVEFCVVKRFTSDIQEESCFPLTATPLYKHHKQTTNPSSTIRSHVTSFPVSAHPVCAHREDGLEEKRCVLTVSQVVKVNIHPQEKTNNSFGAFQ